VRKSRFASLLLWIALLPDCNRAPPGVRPINDVLVASVERLDFGPQPAGGRAESQVGVRNLGLRSVESVSVELVGDLRGAFQVGQVPPRIEQGGEASLQVIYQAPSSGGNDRATLVIRGEDSRAISARVEVLGRIDPDCGSPAANCRNGRRCGTVVDACGGSVACGGCEAPQICGGDGRANVCSTYSICSSDRWCWSNPLPQGHSLMALAGSAADNLWAVGEYGIILHFDGSAWTAVPSGARDDLRDVWSGIDASKDVWAVGLNGRILRWNGRQWLSVPPFNERSLFGIWGATNEDLWAVGDYGTILHWLGDSWNAFASPTIKDLRSIWGTDANNIWAVGAEVVLRWNGREWATQTFPSNQAGLFSAVWGVGGDVWIGGDRSPLHWNGSGWVEGPGPSGLRAFWGTGRNDVWAGSASSRKIFHWNGSAWTENFETPSYVGAMWGMCTGDPGSGQQEPPGLRPGCTAWAAGGNGAFLRLSPAGWTMHQGEFVDQNFSGVWGSGTRDVWAVGGTGAARRRMILRWNGQRWSSSAEAPQPLTSIAGLDADDVWAVGERGTVLHWEGAHWSTLPSPTSGRLNKVWVAGRRDVWAAGEGALLHWNGSAWSNQIANSRYTLSSINGSVPQSLWAVGAISGPHTVGLLLRGDGNTWTPVTLPTRAPLTDVWARSDQDVWVVGARGTLLHWNGSTWSSGPSSSLLFQFQGIWGNEAGEVWAVGQSDGSRRGLILHRRNGVWFPVDSGVNHSLIGVWGTGLSDVWAVGLGGTILRYVPSEAP